MLARNFPCLGGFLDHLLLLYTAEYALNSEVGVGGGNDLGERRRRRRDTDLWSGSGANSKILFVCSLFPPSPTGSDCLLRQSAEGRRNKKFTALKYGTIFTPNTV